MSEQKDLRDHVGLVATIITSGVEQPEFGRAHEEMRVQNERAGFQKIEYRRHGSPFVETGRDDMAVHALQEGYDAILYLDADMTFPPETYMRLMHLAFEALPESAAVGGYCNLKGNFLPTIDTGTGTWEPHFPHSGIKNVIRTGGACLLVKTQALRMFGPPWFRAKIQNKPLDALSTVDNFARCKLSDRNPFYESAEWMWLVREAQKAGPGESGIGEDSGFCDRLKAAGGLIFVDTDLVCGHVGKKIFGADDLKNRLDEFERMQRLAVGVQG